MTTVTQKNQGTKKLFASPLLEKLSRTHIAVPLSIFSIYSSALLYWSITHTALTAFVTTALFFVGFAFFTWVEYLVHRYIFHLKPTTEWRRKLQYTIHGVHHEYPKDKERLAMPPVLSATFSTLLLLVFRIIMGDFVFAFLPGFLAGYIFYLSVHYIVHTCRPPLNFLRHWWINHSIHHYKDGKIIFGVTSPFWDYVYGTKQSIRH